MYFSVGLKLLLEASVICMWYSPSKLIEFALV